MRENNSNYKSQSLRVLSLVSLAFALFYNPYPTSAKEIYRQNTLSILLSKLEYKNSKIRN